MKNMPKQTEAEDTIEIIQPSIEVIFPTKPATMLAFIEECGRVCYQSTPKDNSGFIKRLIVQGHESVLEHSYFSAKLLCDRGITHEIVRHRLASYSQESTRYVAYRKIKKIVSQPGLPDTVLLSNVSAALKAYTDLLSKGYPPQLARSALPTAVASQIVMTMNLREWRHFFKLRVAKRAHPAMRVISASILKAAMQKLQIVFSDIEIPEDIRFPAPTIRILK